MSSPKDGLVAGAGVVIRTPLLPFDTIQQWTALAGDPAASRAFLVELVSRPEVREALFVASPALHEGIERWLVEPDSAAGQRAETSIVRYLARMAGRATPFGLFSGVSPGTMGPRTELQLAPRSETRRRTRIDNDYLFALVEALAKRPDVRARLTYRTSDSLYEVAGRIRYAQPRLAGRDRSYHLVSVERTPYLDATLTRARARDGARLADLAAALVADDPTVTLEEAQVYIDQLVDEHLIVPALGIVVTGPEPLDALLDQLAAAGLDDAHRILTEARARLAAIDAAGVGNDPARYHEVAATLAPLPAKAELSRLFQVDMVKPASVTLGSRVVGEVARAIEWLRQISRAGVGTAFDDFRRQFGERYEGRRVPLSEVLDDESGLGFESSKDPGSEGSPLLAGLGWPMRRGANRIAFGAVESHLQRRLAALPKGAELVLDDDDLKVMRNDRPPPLPDAISAMFRVAGEPGNETVLVESAGGPSGARLLGRFCHASPEIDAMVRAHIAAEEALRPSAVFAEIVHLNEGRIGNILCRPVLRGHEIVFLGISGAAAGQQIGIDDLEVSVAGARVVLWSKRLDKEVIPRMSTAHNFRLRSLGVYRFLCALQNQDSAGGVGFDWGHLARMPQLPRVRLGRAILHRATWLLDDKDLEPITKVVRDTKPKGKHGMPAADRAKILAAVAALREHRGLPRFVALSEGDNELPIDLDNPALAHVFADDLSGRSEYNVIELFPPPDALTVRAADGGYTNEVVVTFTRKPGAPPPALRQAPAPTIARTFRPGSAWLYAKLYCGASTADHVIRQALVPLVRDAMAAGHADRWFFIRYGDPDNHLRIRFHGDPGRLAAHVLPALEAAIAPLAAAGAVRKVVLDTYERELERYGGDLGMELCEEVFWRDSECVFSIVELLDGDAGGDARWRLAVRGSDSMLVALGFPPEVRQRIFSTARDSIGAEHEANAAFYAQLGDRFKKERAALDASFAPTEEHDLWPGFELLARRDEQLVPIGVELRRRLGEQFDDLAWSLVHMHCNRLLHASQRSQELVIYDFLRRLYESNKARKKA